MVLLEAFQELNGWHNGPALPVLAARSWQVLSRRRQFLVDLPDGFQNPQVAHSEEWVRYWRKNPVDAWIGSNHGNDATAFFALSEGRFVSKTAVVPEQIETLQELVQQLIDFRFAAYEHRRAAAPAANVIPFVRPVRSGIELPFFPNIRIACGHFKTGTADAEEFRSLRLCKNRPQRGTKSHRSGPCSNAQIRRARHGPIQAHRPQPPATARGAE